MVRLNYNAPIVLGFSFICAVVMVATTIAPMVSLDLVLYDGFQRPWTLLTYAILHSDFNHLIGNLSFLLLLGPNLEEKYGAKKLAAFMLGTVLITGILHTLFFSEGLAGASGVVFLFIILSSFSAEKKEGIPVTFLLVFIIFIGKELWSAFSEDQVSQFAHVLGGITGSIIGLNIRRHTPTSGER